MNLIEAKTKLKQLENEEDYYLQEKELLKSMVLPKGIEITPDKVNGGKREDRMLKYVEILDDKKLDDTLEYIYRKKRILMNYIENELETIGEYDNLKRRIYELRYDTEYIKLNGKKRTFKSIGNLVGYSASQCNRILQKMLSKRNV